MTSIILGVCETERIGQPILSAGNVQGYYYQSYAVGNIASYVRRCSLPTDIKQFMNKYIYGIS